jgi:hypothetical protein
MNPNESIRNRRGKLQYRLLAAQEVVRIAIRWLTISDDVALKSWPRLRHTGVLFE